MRPQFAPSLMCMDFLNVREEMEVLNRHADLYHVDIMDGHYCKNITLSPDMVKVFKSIAERPIDVHLMTTSPMDWIDRVAEAGADFISPHAETINTDAYRVLNYIKELGCKKGVVLNPATPLSAVEHYLNRIDLLTIMTIDVGFAGQPFIEEMLEKIKMAKRLKEEREYGYQIQIDGSCNQNTYRKLFEAGAEIFIVGYSGLFGLENTLEKSWTKMEEIFKQETGINQWF